MESMVDVSNTFSGIYKDKRVLVTGHTGFKGSWLSLWLLQLEANIAGFSLYLPSEPCNFEELKLEGKVTHYQGDVRDKEALSKVFKEFKPQIIFHLAAQPIVRKAYDEPKLTFDTNVGGTVNVLECVKDSESVDAAVIITSDKCYDNVSWEWGYRENDHLGGDDPYSASKACAEHVCRSYIKSYFSQDKSPKLATTRAGNVIGGGDWAQDRIVPDCVKALSKDKKPVTRNPDATRPWQHVLEPLSGYLWLGVQLLKGSEQAVGQAFNFGPNSEVLQSVRELVNLLLKQWGKTDYKIGQPEEVKKESSLLKLCCDKALHRLRWHSVLDFEQTVEFTSQWYKNYYGGGVDIYDFSCEQIRHYVQKATEQKLLWAIE